MTFAEKLKKLRIQNELSQERLAELLSVSRQAITKWENGNGMPDIENLKSIANVFDVTLDSLLREEEEINSTDGGFCWKVAGACGAISFVLAWLIQRDQLADINMGAWGIAGFLIGFLLAYIVLQIKSK